MMKQITKKELLDSILNNPAYKVAVGQLSPEEKKKVESILTGDFLNIMHNMQTLFSSVLKNPDAASQLSQALNAKSGVFNVDASGEEHAARKPE